MSSVTQEALEGMTPEQRQAELAKVKDAVAGDQPTMSEIPFTSVTLFRGVFSGSEWRQDAIVRELTGVDEEAIARMMGNQTPQFAAQFLNAVVAYGTQSLGPYDLEHMGLQERIGLIDGLLVGEKEYLFLNVLRVTYGDERTVPVRCQVCNAMNDISFLLSQDVPVRKMDDPFRTTYEFTCRDGTHLEYKLVTGADQAESLKRANLTVPEQNTIIFSRCIAMVNGQPPMDPLHYARHMGAQDRRLLLNEMNDRQPGPYFEEVKLPCATCGAESSFTPAWSDLLQP
jgi:hypothetical protein